MTLKTRKTLTTAQEARIRAELTDAYDFDPRDPLFGLNRDDHSGPVLKRRAVLRLMAAAGTLTAWHLIPGLGGATPAAAKGGTLTCGWAGVGEISTLDPAQINQVLQFQISSNGPASCISMPSWWRRATSPRADGFRRRHRIQVCCARASRSTMATR
jgi:hypothetical protein